MKYAAENHHSSAILVRSPDSDIFLILLYYAAEVNATIIFDTGHGNQRRLFDLSALSMAYGQEYCKALLSLHAFNHCDTMSAFVHIGKVKRIKTFEKFPCFQQSLRELSLNWELDECTMVDLEHFVRALYGRAGYHDVNKLCYDMFVEKCQLESLNASKGADVSLLLPCREALKMHIKCVNYQVRIWKLSHIQNPEIQSPLEHGWIIINNKLEPQWADVNILPTSVIDILDEDDLLSKKSDEEDLKGENMQDVFFNDDDD